ncbi:hypothetical protein BG015_006824, partial [Linnemannia schmuckeri]
MARINPLHIDIPPVPSHLHMKKSSRSEPLSPSGMFNTTNTTTKEGAEEASFFSLTRNGFQYPDSPSSDISSPMMTPLPFKMMMPQPLNNNIHLLTPATPAVSVVEKDDRKKLREYEFPSPAAVTSVAIKVEGQGIQPYQNHPFTQLRQQRQPPQQQRLPTPLTAKATPVLSYSAKYANFTNNSSTPITTTSTTQTVVRVSPRSTHFNNQDNDNNSRKPSTTMALSMIEKEKMAYQYPTHRISMVSPPPPPYISFSSPSSSDHGAGVGTAPSTTTITQSAASAAAVIAISPPLHQQVPDQHLTYDPTIIITPASLTAHIAKSKRHSLPVALSRSASSSSATSLSSPAIIVAGSGVTMSEMVSTTTVTPRVFSPKASRDAKRHSLAVIPSSMSPSTSSPNSMQPRHKTAPGLGHRSISNMPPQAIPIFGSTGSAADMMKPPPTAFNPRSSFSSPSSTRLFERAVTTVDTEKDLSALIGPEHDHKNTLMSLSHTNITAHNAHHHNNNNTSTLSSPPRMQGLLRIASLQRATAAASAAERNLILSTSRIGGGMGPPERTEFPGFWEDAKQHNMHWT